MACWEFQSPESLCADRKELGSQSPEFPWHEDEDDEDEEEWEPAPQDCDLQAVCDSETWVENGRLRPQIQCNTTAWKGKLMADL